MVEEAGTAIVTGRSNPEHGSKVNREYPRRQIFSSTGMATNSFMAIRMIYLRTAREEECCLRAFARAIQVPNLRSGQRMCFCLRIFIIRGISGGAGRRKGGVFSSNRKNPGINSLEVWKNYSLCKRKLLPAARKFSQT